MRFITLLDQVDAHWTIKEKAKYIYRNLGKILRYDERFMFSNNISLLEKIYFKTIDIEQDEEVQIVCRTANLIYYQLLKKLGIGAELIYKRSKVERAISIDDVALVFYDELGCKIYTNIIGDLENCKFDLRTEWFGISQNSYEMAQDVIGISALENEQIDRRIKEIQGDYSEIFFNQLADEVKSPNRFKIFLSTLGIDTNDLSGEDILKLKMHYVTQFVKFYDKTAGFGERWRFYKRLFLGSVLDKVEKKNFRYYVFFKEDGENIDVLSVIELVYREEKIYYIYSHEECTYVKVDIEELLEMTSGYEEKKGRQLIKRNHQIV